MDTRTANPIDVRVGVRVRARRLELGMSQTELASHLGITFQQVQKYEKGTNRVGAGRMLAIAQTLRVEPAFFFDDTDAGGGSKAGRPTDDADDISRFLQSRDGVELNKAFRRIQSPELRRRIIALVKSVAEEAADAQEIEAMASGISGSDIRQ